MQTVLESAVRCVKKEIIWSGIIPELTTREISKMRSWRIHHCQVWQQDSKRGWHKEVKWFWKGVSEWSRGMEWNVSLCCTWRCKDFEKFFSLLRGKYQYPHVVSHRIATYWAQGPNLMLSNCFFFNSRNLINVLVWEYNWFYRGEKKHKSIKLNFQ